MNSGARGSALHQIGIDQRVGNVFDGAAQEILGCRRFGIRGGKLYAVTGIEQRVSPCSEHLIKLICVAIEVDVRQDKAFKAPFPPHDLG